MSPPPPDQPELPELSPRSARFAKSKAAAAATALQTTRALSPLPADDAARQIFEGTEFDEFNGRPNEDGGQHVPRRTASQSRDLSNLVGPATKDLKLPASALSRIQRFAKAPEDERMFMLFVNTEIILARVKEAAQGWEISLQLKALLRTRLVACLLSPHIPEYRSNLMKHVVALIPPNCKHLLPDETATTDKDLLKTFISDYATTVRNTIKSQIAKSMSKYNAVTKQDVLDASQGWCIGRLCEGIIAKLGTDADLLITTEVQSRIALLRWVYAKHPATAPGAQYWILVDGTLAKQRELDTASMARDIADGLADDIKKYTVDSDQPYALVDIKTVRQESMQGVADAAMRDYYKTVKIVPAKRKSPPN